MKKQLLLLPFIAFPVFLFAQLFTKVTTGPVVTMAGDSRSVNFLDVNNDDWDDILISNGPSGGDFNFLYMNNGDGTFTVITGDDIVTSDGSYDGATFGDYDNDGDEDCIVVTWWNEKDHFFKNNGNGTFTEDISIAPATANGYSEAASWGDYDLDGWLDLYISNSEGDFKNLLYHNNQDGSFTKITSGTQSTDANTSRGVTWIDYDLDGDADLYVANELNEPNDLYQNDGDGTFTKITDGPHVNDTRSSMTASWGDIDNDGDPDLFVGNSGNFSSQKNQLFVNNGNGSFTEITAGDLVNDSKCTFSSSFEDYDNDGDLDIAVSNGFCSGTILNFLYQNDGTGIFTRDLTSITDLATPCSYGCAFGDANNDGFPDLVFATCDNNNTGSNPPDLFYLNNGNGNHWLKIELEGTASNHSAIGAKVKIRANINGSVIWQYREVTAQSGYCSQNSMTIHFGLGNATSVDSVVVIFPGGNDTTLTSVSADQQIFIKEISLTGISNPEIFSAIRSFPNPAQTYFSIEIITQRSEAVTFRLMNATGEMMEERTSFLHGGKNVLQWDVDSLTKSSGLYFLEAEGKGWKERIKIALQ